MKLPEQPLYRIISLESFLSLLLESKTHFVRPTSWEDTFEGCSLRYALDRNKYSVLVDRLNSIFKESDNCIDAILTNFASAESVCLYSFGQCWSVVKDSDAMWRIYSYGKMAIQIESSYDDILKAISKDEYVKNSEIVCRIVEYDVKKEEKESGFESFCSRGKPIIEPFFHKRKAFEHEKEVRILISDGKLNSYYHKKLNNYRRELKNYSDRGISNSEVATSVISKVNSREDFRALQKMTEEENALDISVDLRQYIKGVRVHPQAKEWYRDVIKDLCNKFEVPFYGQSDLYEEA